jgi:hypothetical protein
MNIIGCDLHTRYQVVAWIEGEQVARTCGSRSAAFHPELRNQVQIRLRTSRS